MTFGETCNYRNLTAETKKRDFCALSMRLVISEKTTIIEKQTAVDLLLFADHCYPF